MKVNNSTRTGRGKVPFFDMNKKLILESFSMEKALTVFKALQVLLNRSDECTMEIRLPGKKYVVIESERNNGNYGLSVVDNEGYLFAMEFDAFNAKDLARCLVDQINITWTPGDLAKARIVA